MSSDVMIKAGMELEIDGRLDITYDTYKILIILDDPIQSVHWLITDSGCGVQS
jgi:hypothetical protein